MLCSVASSAGVQELQTTGPDTTETLRLGEQIYRRGVLPAGEPVQALVKGDISVEGTAFTCASCHLRSGLGSVEGRVFTPPTNGATLFKPLKRLYKGFEVISSTPLRPAYTDESLAELLRAGVHPSGRLIDDVMPRYLLDDKDMGILIYYLKTLSSEFSPGFSDNTLRLATVITDDVSPEDRDAMLAPIENYIKTKNNMASIYGHDRRQARMARAMVANSMDTATLRLELSCWELKGPPETWKTQLEEYYRRDPVFAFIGGISRGEWKPVHEFCESNRIPCVFPLTDLPVISDTDWYTMYLSKGYYQEGESTARYLDGIEELPKETVAVQIVRESGEGIALSAGFEKTWLDLGHGAPVTVTLKAGEKLTGERIQQLMAASKPSIVLLWDGPESMPAMDAFLDGRYRPRMVFVSCSYLGKGLWELKDGVRDFTYIAYPFRLPQDEARYKFNVPSSKNADVRGDAAVVSKRMYSIVQVLTMALIEMRGNYYRDNFLDVIGMLPDFPAQQSGGGMKSAAPVPLYERLSFGPGQRYASKGCYIVQLTKGPKPEILKKSEWVIH